MSTPEGALLPEPGPEPEPLPLTPEERIAALSDEDLRLELIHDLDHCINVTAAKSDVDRLTEFRAKFRALLERVAPGPEPPPEPPPAPDQV